MSEKRKVGGMVELECVEKCFYDDRLWDLGESMFIDEDEDIPTHFMLRPGKGGVIQDVREQLDRFKAPYDSAWGLKRLEEMLEGIKKKKKAKPRTKKAVKKAEQE